MDDKFLDDFLEKVKNRTPEEIEADNKWFYDNYVKKNEIVKTFGYAKWLSSFLEKYKQIDDDCDANHQYSNKTDQEYFELISWFSSYLSDLAKKQAVNNITDKNNEFEANNYYFKIGDKYFHTSTMVGQGSITFMEKVDKKPRRKCIVVPMLNKDDQKYHIDNNENYYPENKDVNCDIAGSLHELF